MEEYTLVRETNATDSPKRACIKDLLLAIESKPFDEVKGMIEERKRSIRLFNVGFKVLVKALKLEKIDVANCLLDNKCRVNLEKKANIPTTTPLHLAVKIRDTKLVDRLLEANASVTAFDEECHTPLHLAFARNGGDHGSDFAEDTGEIHVRKHEEQDGLDSRAHRMLEAEFQKVIKGFLDRTVLTMSPVTSKKKGRKVIVKHEC